MRPVSLAAPVSTLSRSTLQIESVDSLSLAAARFRQNGAAVLPVVRDTRLVGVVTDAKLAEALGQGVEPTDAVADWLEQPQEILNFETGAEALRRLEGGGTMVVIDQDRRVLGLLSAADLWPRRRPQLRPPMVGGMATPFGVYLTTGAVSGGAPKWALVATGAAMYAMMWTALVTVGLSAEWLDARHVPESYLNVFLGIGVPLVAMALMRLVPLSGIHGAEHQVVHAIEREEELRPEVIRRMPRVHPRCGTNIATGAIIFLTLATWPWVDELTYRLVAAAIATAFLWRTVGSILQQYVTTKRPSDKQLEGGIRAGKMLLDQYAKARSTVPSVWQRIWNSGILHVIAGASATAGLSFLVAHLTHVDLGPLVSF